MIIQCTNCKARFRVADGKLKKDQTKVRCAKCEQIFIAKVGENAFPDAKPQDQALPKESPIQKTTQDLLKPKEEAPGFAPDSKGASGGQWDAVKKDQSTTSQIESSIKSLVMDELTSSELPVKEPTSMPQAQDGEFPDPVTSNLPREAVEGRDGPPRRADALLEHGDLGEKPIAKIDLKASKRPAHRAPRSRKDFAPPKYLYAIYPVLTLVSLMIGLTVSGVKPHWKNMSILSARVPDADKKGLNVVDISSYNTQNIAGEELFTIEGNLFNNSDSAVSEVSLEAELYSPNGLFLNKSVYPCCLHLSGFALHEVSNLDSLKLLYKKEQLDEIKPYQGIGFTLVSKKPDEDVGYFKIKIVNDSIR